VDTYGCYDGWFRFFPSIDGDGTTYDSYQVRISPSENDEISRTMDIDLDDLPEDRKIEVKFEDYEYQCPDALDLAFVVDTTGSMSDELQYLTQEFENIVSAVRSQFQVSSMRFGLVVYRDTTDAYVTRSYEFTDSVTTMQERLDQQEASGGGDYEEAVEEGLKDGIDLDWSDGNTARMMFHVADAPPHRSNMEETMNQILRARDKGIHIYPLASSGVGDTAEFVMRVAGVLAHGRYLFLTDDSGIGNPHAEPHIPYYYVTTLEDLMVRLVESELRGKTVKPTEEQIIRKVGNWSKAPNDPLDDDGQEQTPEVNDTQPPASNETGNTTDPHSDPSYDDGGGHDYPDGSEGGGTVSGMYDHSSGGEYKGSYADSDPRDSSGDDGEILAAWYDGDDDDVAYAPPEEGSDSAPSPFSSIWIIILGVAGLLLILSAVGGRSLTVMRKRSQKKEKEE
jgi:hypothetical protein